MSTPAHVVRWVVSYLDHHGNRVMMGPCQGRYTFATLEEAQASAEAINSGNNSERLADIYGPQAVGTLAAAPIKCYPDHHDPIGIFTIEEAAS